MYDNPSVQDFKDQFARDFPYNADPALGVTDTDIANAFKRTNVQINPRLFNSQESYSMYYLLLAAHFLVTVLSASAVGVAGGYTGLITSKSVGGVSVSYSIPQRYLDNPQLGFLAKTNYGAEYLAYIITQMVGSVYTVPGSTRA